MSKLAVLGQNPRNLVDCSDIIPVPANTKLPPPTIPAGKSLADIEVAVRHGSFLCMRCVLGGLHCLAVSALPLRSLPSAPLPVCDSACFWNR